VIEKNVKLGALISLIVWQSPTRQEQAKSNQKCS